MTRVGTISRCESGFLKLSDTKSTVARLNLVLGCVSVIQVYMGFHTVDFELVHLLQRQLKHF